MAVSKEQLEGSTGIIKWVVIGGVALVVVNKIGMTFGDDEEDIKSVDEAGKDVAWNPDFVSNVTKAGIENNALVGGTVTSAQIFYTKLCKQIKDGFGYRWTPDDEIAVESAFRACNTKIRVSFLVKFYYSIYQLNLWTECRDRLSALEMLKITDYVNNLPKYMPR